ncbi:MAG: molecular chaperone [Chloroflexota bacterium]
MSDFVQSLQQLSAFFFASDAKGMKTAYFELAKLYPAPIVDDWSAVEFSFNRLFVGPRALLAPPYASIYLDNDQSRVMSESTIQIRQFYGLLGLVSPWLNKIPDDHIALELDALWQIETALLNSDSPQLQDMRDYLLAHLQEWTPKFRQQIHAIDDVNPAILHIVEMLNQILSQETSTTILKSIE